MSVKFHFKKKVNTGLGEFALDVSFYSEKNRLVILGASGSGKSASLAILGGLSTPDSGMIEIGEITQFESLRQINLSPQQRRFAYVFQDYALFPHLTVRQNIGFSLSNRLLIGRDRSLDDRIDYWIELCELRKIADRRPSQISGGEKQRTAIARALNSEPKAILLDEPFAALDTKLRRKMRDLLNWYQKEREIPLILVTHDAQDAEFFGDTLLYLSEGRVHYHKTR